MFVAPKVGFSSPGFHAPKFQGFHFEEPPDEPSAHVGRDPKTNMDVYVTNDDDQPAMDKEGSDKLRFEMTKAAHEQVMASKHMSEEEQASNLALFNQYKELFFAKAMRTIQSSSPSSSKKKHREPKTKYVPKKEILLNAFTHGLLLSNALLHPTGYLSYTAGRRL